MIDIGDTSCERNILEFIEKKEIEKQKGIFFETYVTIDEIIDHIIKKDSPNEGIIKKSIIRAINSLVKKRKVIRLIDNGHELGYRSRTAEIIRLLYNLRLKTSKGDHLDVATLKYTRIDKIIPKWDKDLSYLDNSDVRDLLDFENPYGIDPINVLIKALKSSKYELLSDFQLESYVKTLEQTKKLPGSVVLTATTGSGKSIAFLLAPLLYSIASVLKEEKGTTSLFIYPRNALAEDQFKTIKALIDLINSELKKEFEDFPHISHPKVTINKDFRATSREDQDRIYTSPPTIIITNTETLKKRLMYFRAHNAFKTTKFLIFDEVHLYYGMTGTNTLFLIRRLKSLLRKYQTNPVFVGASATIAEPRSFCKSLFSLKEKPLHISSESFKSLKSGHTHHIFLKPIGDRSSLSVAIDATSCIIHNRRDGLLNEREEEPGKPKLVDEVKKTICFADSLDTVGAWNHYLQDFEKPFGYKPRPKKGVGYSRYFQPCDDKPCINGNIDINCPNYLIGSCWTLSLDDGTNIIEYNNRKYRADAIRSDVMTSKISDIEENLFKDRYTPWAKDAIIASPVLEVGVDIDNVKEIILFRAIKSPSSYRQKVGRAGRELFSESLAASIMSDSPIDNYFFKNYLKLVSGTLAPLPLNDENIDVASSHLISGIIDFLASKKIDVFSVGKLTNPQRTFEEAKDFISTNKMELRDYLEIIYPDQTFVEKSINEFLKIIDNLVDKSFFKPLELVDNPSYIELISEMSGKRRSEHIRAIQSEIATKNNDIAPKIKAIEFINEKISKIRNSFTEVPTDLRENLKIVIDKLQKSIERGNEFNQDDIEFLIEEMHNEGPDLSHVVTYLRELKDALKAIDYSEIKKYQEDNLNILKIESFIANVRSELNYGLYLDSILRVHPYLQKSWLPPANLFENSKKKKVTIDINGERRTEDIDSVFTLLYPGKHSWRYGKDPIKVKIQDWPDIGTGEVSVSRHILEHLCDVESSVLPKEIKNQGDKVPIFYPKVLKCIKVEKTKEDGTSNYPLCLICGRAVDGDEYCPHFLSRDSYYFSPTLPKGVALVHSYVNHKEKMQILSLENNFKQIISDISFSQDIRVLKILYGFERHVLGDIYRLYYDKILGDSYKTEGIIYQLNNITGNIAYLRNNLEEHVLRDLRMMQFANELNDFLRSNYFSIWDSMTIFKAMILSYIEKEGVPETYKRIEDISKVSKPAFMAKLDYLYKNKGKGIPKRVEEVFKKLDAFKMNSFDDFLKEIYMHTLAHYLYISTMLLLGINEKEIGYYLNMEDESIIIYDSVEGGNGSARTMKDKNSLFLLNVQNNLEKVRTSKWPLSPHPRDLLSYFEELTAGCNTAHADTILLDILDERIEIIKNAEESDEERFEALKIIQREYGIDEFDLSYLDSIIRQKLHIPLYYLPNRKDILFYSFIPEYFVEKLTEEDIEQILPSDYNLNLHEKEKVGRLNEIVKDSLSICVNACPSCLITPGCNEGIFNSKYTLDRRIIEFIINYINTPNTIIFDDSITKSAEAAIKLFKNGDSVVYISGSFNKQQEILKCAYSLLGQRLENKFVRLANLKLYEGNFTVKLEMT